MTVMHTGQRLSERLVKVFGITLSLALGVAGVVGFSDPASGAQSQMLNVVVLGDSYSAGNGAADYYGPRNCYRSHANWAEKYATALRNEGYTINLENRACSGATTTEFFNYNDRGTSTQIGPCTPDPDSPDEIAVQLSDTFGVKSCDRYLKAQEADIGYQTDLILQTFGGNDIKFADIVKDCFALRLVGACQSDVEYAQHLIDNGTVSNNILSVLEREHLNSPNAKVVLLGYPQLIDDSYPYVLSATIETPTGSITRSYDAEAGVRAVGTSGRTAQQAAVLAANLQAGTNYVTYIDDVQSTFAGHEPDARAFHSNPQRWLTELLDGAISATYYHPNPTGHEQYAELLEKHDGGNAFDAGDTGDTGSSGSGGSGNPPPQTFATTTSIEAHPNPSVHGQQVTITGTVESGGNGTPTGRLSIYDGGNLLGSGNLVAGSFSVRLSSLSTGGHGLSADYQGNGTYLRSTSEILPFTVNKAATNTDLRSSVNPAVYCQTVTFHSHVSVVPPGSGTPTGPVTYRDDGSAIGSDDVNENGDASIDEQFFHVGVHPITATYQGDENFESSTSPTFNQIVNKAPTITTVTSNPDGTNLFGRNSAFTATVSVPPPGCGTPTGTVTFTVDGVAVQSGDLPASLQATLSTTALLPGTHVIGAAYSGDDNFLGSSGSTNYLITCTRTITGKVSGDVAASGESTCLVGAKLNGNIVVPVGTRVAIVNSSTTGAFVSNGGANMIAVCGSRIGGSVQVLSNRELVMIGDPGAVCTSNTINGAFLLRNNANGVEAMNNAYGGTLSNINNSGPGPYGQTTTISGNVKR
jgi:lysophospholipase L1-like esterase